MVPALDFHDDDQVVIDYHSKHRRKPVTGARLRAIKRIAQIELRHLTL